MLRGILLFLAFAALAVDRPNEGLFSGLWTSPVEWIGSILFTGLPVIRLPLWDLLLIALAIVSHLAPGALTRRARALDGALVASFAGVAFVTLVGVARGGSGYQAFFQAHWFVMGLVFAVAATAILKTDGDFRAFALVFIAAAFLRAGFGFYVYQKIVKKNPHSPPAYLTSHDDTVLYVGALVILLLYAIVQRGRVAKLAAAAGVPILLVIIALNQRRVAWVALAGAVLAAYLALRPSRLRRRLWIGTVAAAPLLFLYVAVGKDRTGRFFAPVQAFYSMSGDTADDSTISRRVENDGLIATLRHHPIVGTGFGIEYIEVDPRYAPGLAKQFPQYRYIPHNSLLGLLAFSGWLGFSLIWAIVPLTVCLAVWTHRHALSRISAAAGLSVAGCAVAYTVQCWADMGIQSLSAAILMGACVAAASRLSVAAARTRTRPRPGLQAPPGRGVLRG